ncbi:MAG: NAD+ synthase, partial [Gaiellaceae bacterium]
MRLALAQINPVVGDLVGNQELILERLAEAKENAADLVVFPELAVTGYPPEDLLLRPGFIRAAEESVEKIAREARGATVLVGAPRFDRDLYNACYVCSAGEIKAVYRKRFLPNYGVFDEDRYFAPGRDLILLEHGKTLVGLTVCEDMWQPGPPATDLALGGAELLVNISASPFYVGRPDEREEMFVTRARDNSCFVAFCNTVGGQDELIFDGHSCVLDDEGNVLARAPGFEEALLIVDIEPQEVIGRRLSDVRRRALAREREQIPPVEIIHVGSPGPSSNGNKAVGEVVPFVDEIEQMRRALELGLGDYVGKNGFREVVVGVSGGIDSAVTAALAAETLGPEHVHCVSMPSRYSSEGTRTDARRLAESLGCPFMEIPIGKIVDAFGESLEEAFAGTEPDLAEENIQARARGVLLMALSNKFGWMLVATGNKSELSVGYATLYGDMAGGFALLKDVY